MVKVTENWAATLRAMKVGDIVVFPVRAISSVNTTISRLRLEMCVENADWKRTGEVDRKRGEFKIGILDRKSTRLNSSHPVSSRMPSSA